MNTMQLKGSWNIAKGKLKQKLARLTQDENQFVGGKENELTGRIQKRTGQAGKKIARIAGGCCGTVAE